MTTDNPAARLYALLSAAHELEHSNRPIKALWADTLGVDQSQVTVAMAGVAGLLDDIARQVSRLNDPRAESMVRHYGPIWANALFTPDRNLDQPSSGIVDPGALATLGGLATLLSNTASEGVVPDDDQVSDLRDALQATLQEVLADRTTAREIRTLLVARLHDMTWALDHLATAGPEGVKAAAERLAGALALQPESDRRNPLVRKVMEVALHTWSAFTFVGEAHDAIEGWTALAGLLPRG